MKKNYVLFCSQRLLLPDTDLKQRRPLTVHSLRREAASDLRAQRHGVRDEDLHGATRVPQQQVRHALEQVAQRSRARVPGQHLAQAIELYALALAAAVVARPRQLNTPGNTITPNNTGENARNAIELSEHF